MRIPRSARWIPCKTGNFYLKSESLQISLCQKIPFTSYLPPIKEILHFYISIIPLLPMQIKAHAANHNSAANDISNSNRQQINSHKTAPVKPCQFFCSQPYNSWAFCTYAGFPAAKMPAGI